MQRKVSVVSSLSTHKKIYFFLKWKYLMFTNSNHIIPCLRQQSNNFSDRHLEFSILTQTEFLKQRRCFVQPIRVVTAKPSFFNVIQIKLDVRSPTSHGLDCLNIVDSIIPKTYFFDSVGGKLFEKRCHYFPFVVFDI